MEWIILDPAVVNFVKLLMSLGEIMFFNRVNGKCQLYKNLRDLRVLRGEIYYLLIIYFH